MIIDFSKVLLYWNNHTSEIIEAFFYSLGYLILLPTLIGILVAIPLSFIVVKCKHMNWIIQVFNFLGAIPSMIMFLILIVLGFGIGLEPSIIALVIYAIVPIMTYTIPALQSIDSSKGIALGMNFCQTIIYIDIPMSSPQIISGIKMSLIYGISNCILCSSIGTPGLGKLVMVGLSQMRFDLAFIGTVPLLLLVILFEFIGTSISTSLSKKIKVEV